VSEAGRRQVVVAVDPGRSKCGLAAVSGEGVLRRRIVDVDDIAEAAAALARECNAAVIVVGSRTGHRQVVDRLRLATDLPIERVEEDMTTLQARRRYWQDNPPRGLWRLVPEGLRAPREPIDDYAAVLLAERYLSR
jgi:RNase H-fold protein (predicted Holliday junction resolvase)